LINGASFGDFREAALSALADLTMDLAGEASGSVVIVSDDAIATAAKPSEIGSLLNAAVALEERSGASAPAASPLAEARASIAAPSVTMLGREPIVAEPLESLPLPKAQIAERMSLLARAVTERAATAGSMPDSNSDPGLTTQRTDANEVPSSILVAGFDRNGPTTAREDERSQVDPRRTRASDNEAVDDLERDPRRGCALEGTTAVRARMSAGTSLRRSFDARYDYVDSEGRPWVVVSGRLDAEALAALPEYAGAAFLTDEAAQIDPKGT